RKEIDCSGVASTKSERGERRARRDAEVFSLRALRALRLFGGTEMHKTLKAGAVLVAVIGAGVVWSTARPTGQMAGMPSTKNGDWTHYTADMRGTKYSPLDQINATNFNKMEVAWRFKTDNLGTRPEFKLEGTPLAIKGVLYVTAGTRRSVVALDGRTGELIWSHSYREGNRAAIAPRQLSGRGVAYW